MTCLREVPASHPSVPNTLKHLGTLFELRERDYAGALLGYVGRRDKRSHWLCASADGAAGTPCWSTRNAAYAWLVRRVCR